MFNKSISLINIAQQIMMQRSSVCNNIKYFLLPLHFSFKFMYKKYSSTSPKANLLCYKLIYYTDRKFQTLLRNIVLCCLFGKMISDYSIICFIGSYVQNRDKICENY